MDRAHAALGLMWATGPGDRDPQQVIAAIEEAIAGVSDRHRELELRLESTRFMAAFLTEGLMQETPERFADLDGRTAGSGRTWNRHEPRCTWPSTGS